MSHSPLAKIAMNNSSHQAYAFHQANEAAKEIDKIIKEIDDKNTRIQALKDQVIALLGEQLKEVKNNEH
jgi:predicted transcriptional regulator